MTNTVMAFFITTTQPIHDSSELYGFLENYLAGQIKRFISGLVLGFAVVIAASFPHKSLHPQKHNIATFLLRHKSCCTP
jgi:hypothetical protein